MRITNKMLVSNMMNNLNSNLERMQKVQQQMSTGKKFQLPSDDPIGVSKSLRLNTDISKIKQFQRNLNDARSWLEITENSIAQMGEVLQRTKELTVQAANGTNADGDLESISAEIEQLRDELIKLSNSTYAGRNVFTGHKTDKDLLDNDGKYIVDKLQTNEVSNYNIGVSASIGTNIVGSRLFGSADYQVNTYIDELGFSDEQSSSIEGNYLSFPESMDISGNINIDIDGTIETVDITGANIENISQLASHLQTKIDSSAIPAGDILVKNDRNRLKFIAKDPSKDITFNDGTVTMSQLGFNNADKINKLEGSSIVNIGLDETDKKFDIIIDETTHRIELNSDISTVGDLATEINTQLLAQGETDVTVSDAGGKLGFNSVAATAKEIKISELSIGTNNYEVQYVKKGQKSHLIEVFDNLKQSMDAEDSDNIRSGINKIDEAMENLLSIRAEVGAKANRLELTENRLDSEELNFTELLSNNEDADMAEVIMNLKMEENVYRASLSGGAKIIQPSLIDFLR